MSRENGLMWYQQSVNDRVTTMRWYAERYREGVEAQRKANIGRDDKSPAYWPEQIAWAEKCAIDCDTIANEMVRAGKVLA